ncbi:hypothetical protein DYH09_22680 [bacterium CPR1]|nr:hypothetical protein [bacterium CPR1]
MSTCPRCNQPMESGFSVELGRNDVYQSVWHPGPPGPRQDKILGINLASEKSVEVDPARTRPITTYRCSGCGFLESYAL